MLVEPDRVAIASGWLLMANAVFTPPDALYHLYQGNSILQTHAYFAVVHFLLIFALLGWAMHKSTSNLVVCLSALIPSSLLLLAWHSRNVSL